MNQGYVLVKVRGDRGRSYGIGYPYVRPKSTTIWSNIDGNLMMVIAHPPMVQFDGIVINIWQNRKVHSDENLWLGKGNGSCQPMAKWKMRREVVSFIINIMRDLH